MSAVFGSGLPMGASLGGRGLKRVLASDSSTHLYHCGLWTSLLSLTWLPQAGRKYQTGHIRMIENFQNQVQTNPARVLSQNVIVVTCMVKPAGCGLVSDV